MGSMPTIEELFATDVASLPLSAQSAWVLAADRVLSQLKAKHLEGLRPRPCTATRCRPRTRSRGGRASHDPAGPRLIVNFRTKAHWRSASRLEDISAGLGDLARVIEELEITSIAVPALGCGLGGLAWTSVEPLIHDALGDLPGVEVLGFAPQP